MLGDEMGGAWEAKVASPPHPMDQELTSLSSWQFCDLEAFVPSETRSASPQNGEPVAAIYWGCAGKRRGLWGSAKPTGPLASQRLPEQGQLSLLSVTRGDPQGACRRCVGASTVGRYLTERAGPIEGLGAECSFVLGAVGRRAGGHGLVDQHLQGRSPWFHPEPGHPGPLGTAVPVLDGAVGLGRTHRQEKQPSSWLFCLLWSQKRDLL